jgi:xylulokinase
MSVLLSAASCVSWVTQLTGARDEAALLEEVEERDRACDELFFLPYLSGERTPHNDPHASGVFVGLRHDTDRAALGRAVLEGVAFAFADAQAALQGSSTTDIREVSVIGGGARSSLWGKILASALARPLLYRDLGELGPALGATRLARLSLGHGSPAEVCIAPPLVAEIQPDPALQERYARRLPEFRALYRSLSGHFRAQYQNPGA